jgi:hypothetical protein
MRPVLIASAVVLIQVSVAAAQPPAAALPQQVTVIGCVTRNGAVDPDKGTRELNVAPNALALTDARVVTTGRSRTSAVPGSVPAGEDSGTIPLHGSVVGRQATPNGNDTVGFALTGKTAGLADFVGRRVQVVATMTPAPPAAITSANNQPRGTTGTTSSAHPSADLQTLTVMSFTTASGGCR